MIATISAVMSFACCEPGTSLEALTKTYQEFSDEDIYWLEKCVEAEETDTGYRAKYLAACCILNRARGGRYGKSLTEVIFYPKQFEVVSNGRMMRLDPTEETKQACRDALENTEKWVIGFSQGDLHSGWAEVQEVINGEYFYRSKKK